MITIHKDVVNDLVIAAPAEECRALDFVENVAVDLGAADAIVHINAHGTHSHSPGMMNEVVPNPVAAEGIIAPSIDRPHIAGFQGDVVNLIELDQVIVAVEKDRRQKIPLLGLRGVIGDLDGRFRRLQRGVLFYRRIDELVQLRVSEGLYALLTSLLVFWAKRDLPPFPEGSRSSDSAA